MSGNVNALLERLRCLNRLNIVDVSKASPFDAVVELACALSGMPLSLISFFDQGRQWVKAAKGVTLQEVPGEQSFCAVTFAAQGPLVIDRASTDPRFEANVFVREHGVECYIGFPLRHEGQVVGTLCVMGCPDAEIGPAVLHNLELLTATTEKLLRAQGLASDLGNLRRELELREARFKQTEKAAKVGGFQVDLRSGQIHWSDQVYRNVGLPVGTPLTPELVLSCYAPEEVAEMKSRLADNASGIGKGTNRHYRIITPQGEERWMHVVTEVEVVDGVPQRTFGIVQDVSDRYRHQRQLELAVVTDSLTGLGNRASFVNHVKSMLAMNQPAVGLLLVDVDRFKTLNDTLGHAAGDIVLVQIAQRLLSISGADKRSFRLGGDEFAVVFSGEDVADRLDGFADDLVRRSARPITVGASAVMASVSLGGALWRDGLSFEELCQNADFALYHAKETRRGGFVMFEDGLRTRMSARLNAIRLTEQAIAEERLVPFYQPVFDLASGAIAGVEALVRMKMPDGRLVAAAEFADALTDHVVSYRVTSLMLDQVARDFKTWQDSGWAPPYVGINVSPADFNSGDLERRLDHAFASRGLSLDRVILEITESVFLDRAEAPVVAMLNRLRERGVAIALDDFGTGFASLTHLRQLPVDIIKIDKSFVDCVLTDLSSLAIVELVHGLARRIGLDVVAEGVERQEQADFLTDLGCHFGQGYLFARPMSAETLPLFAASAALERVNAKVRPLSRPSQLARRKKAMD